MNTKAPAVSPFTNLRKEYLACFAIMLCAIIAYALSAQGSMMTDRFYDVLRTTDTRDEVIIIGVDDKSLQALGAWPWDRRVFADLEHALNENDIRMSVYDILFLELREGDKEFQEEISSSQHPIILASKYEGIAYVSSYLAGSGTTAVSALANVEPDSDGKVRRYALPFITGETCAVPLSKLAFNLYIVHESDCAKEETLFRYPKSIATYSLVDVVEGNIPKESLQGKVAFIGSTALDLEDHFVGLGGNKIPGVYVHASMFTSLLNRIHDTPVQPSVAILLLVTMGLLSGYLVYRLQSILTQTLSILGLLTGVMLAGVLLFLHGIMMPLPWLAIVIIASASVMSLIRFIGERRQNVHIQSLFSKYVHKDVLRELMESGTEIKLGGERKAVTVFFSDLRGFTTLSESLSPEELTSTLNGYLSAMTPHILEEKGTIDKFIGDAIMAFWNAPLEVENHALHGVRSALRQHRALDEFNTKNKTTLAMGVGIHSGQAVVGNVGGKDRVNYTILGDTVNLASRIEGLTKKYGVGTIVSKVVRDAVQDPSIAFRTLDVITVVGKSTPTTLYEARYTEDFKEGMIEDYEKAFKYYYEKQWNKAENIWKKLAKAGDLPSEKMLARIPELRKKIDWDGIWRFDEK